MLPPPPCSQQHPPGGLAHQPRASRIRSHHVVEVFDGHLGDGLDVIHARGDQDSVKTAVLGNGRFDHRLGIGRSVGPTGNHCGVFNTGLDNQLGQALGVAAGQRQPGSRFGQGAGGRAA